jgi:hypothetical protein
MTIAFITLFKYGVPKENSIYKGGMLMMKKIKVIFLLTIASFFIPTIPNNPPPEKITSLFSHGIADTRLQAYRYAQITPNGPLNDRYIINNQHHILISFNYPDAGKSYHINRKETSLAQENEVKSLHEAHANIHQDLGIVGLGVSRGASAFFVWLGTHPDESKIQNIRALVLESPFDSIDSVLRYIIGEKLYKSVRIRAFCHGLVSFIFSKYDKNYITPIEAAPKVPKNIPILIICSEEDTRVPADLSKKLYDELRATGHDAAHFVKLKYGFHGKLIESADSETYRNVVHAFYKKYELPHHEEYAQLGQSILDASQPAMDKES